MDSNPFFNAYITRSHRIDQKTIRSEYADERQNDTFYANVDWNATAATITQLITNLQLAFKEANERGGHWYTREIPSYQLEENQEIYCR